MVYSSSFSYLFPGQQSRRAPILIAMLSLMSCKTIRVSVMVNQKSPLDACKHYTTLQDVPWDIQK